PRAEPRGRVEDRLPRRPVLLLLAGRARPGHARHVAHRPLALRSLPQDHPRQPDEGRDARHRRCALPLVRFRDLRRLRRARRRPRGAPDPPARRGPAPMILRAEGLRKLYGEVCSLDGVSLAIDAGEFVSIIGPNGAGKSTLINVLTGVLRPTAGAVTFKDRDVSGLGPARLARLGIARSFQLVQIFPDLTVLETLQAAVVSRLGRGTRLFASL